MARGEFFEVWGRVLRILMKLAVRSSSSMSIRRASRSGRQWRAAPSWVVKVPQPSTLETWGWVCWIENTVICGFRVRKRRSRAASWEIWIWIFVTLDSL